MRALQSNLHEQDWCLKVPYSGQIAFSLLSISRQSVARSRITFAFHVLRHWSTMFTFQLQLHAQSASKLKETKRLCSESYLAYHSLLNRWWKNQQTQPRDWENLPWKALLGSQCACVVSNGQDLKRLQKAIVDRRWERKSSNFNSDKATSRSHNYGAHKHPELSLNNFSIKNVIKAIFIQKSFIYLPFSMIIIIVNWNWLQTHVRADTKKCIQFGSARCERNEMKRI